MVDTATVLKKAPAEPHVLQVHGPGETGWLTAAEVAALTPESVRAQIAALRPFIAEHAAEAERLGRPHPAVWEALRGTGFFYHFMPRRFGGCEFGLEDFLVTGSVIAESCPSTAWAASFTVEHNWLASLFPEAAQKQFFSDGRYIVAPAVTNPPGVAVRVPGGFKVSARWRFASAAMNANWAMGTAVIEGDGFPIPYWFAFPIAQAQVLDTWQVDGLAATGSNDIVVNELFVPEHMMASFLDFANGIGPGAKVHDNVLYRMVSIPFLGLTTTPAIIGGARGAVNIFRERLKTRKVTGTQTVLCEKANMQVLLARVDLMVRTAELLLRSLARDVLDLAVRERNHDADARRAIVAQNAYASSLAREAVRLIIDNCGVGAHYLSDPLQRIMRDVTMASSHLIHDFEVLAEQHGRAQLGLDPVTFFF